MAAPKTNSYALIQAKPFSPNLGAEVYGVDLSKTIPDAQFSEILDAFLKYQVLFFKNQKEIPPEQHVIFGKRFGPLHTHPAAPTMVGHPEIFEIHSTKTLRWQTVSFGTLMYRVMTRHHLGQCCKST